MLQTSPMQREESQEQPQTRIMSRRRAVSDPPSLRLQPPETSPFDIPLQPLDLREALNLSPVQASPTIPVPPVPELAPEPKAKKKDPKNPNNDPNDSKPVLNIDVRISDLYKYTKDLKQYSTVDHEAFRTYEYRLSNVLRKLAIASEQTFDWNDVKNERLELSKRTEEILLLIINDSLGGVPAEDTQLLREDPEHLGRFLRIFVKLKEAFPEDEGAIYGRDLKNIKMKRNETIMTYNKRFSNAYQRARRFKRVYEGLPDLEHYLSTLPIEDSLIQTIQLNLGKQLEQMTIEDLLNHVALAILRVRPSGYLEESKSRLQMAPRITSSALAVSDARQPTEHNGHRIARQERERGGYRQKRLCNRCGLHTSHKSQQCLALGKHCRLCGKTGHFARVCKSAPTSNRITPDLEDEIRVAGCILDLTDSIESTQSSGYSMRYLSDQNDDVVFKRIAIDSGASHCLVGDPKYFLDLKPVDLPLQLADNSKTRAIGVGTARFNLKGMNDELMTFDLKAHLIPGVNLPLISMSSLMKLDCKLCYRHDEPVLRSKGKIIPLTWWNGILTADHTETPISSARFIQSDFELLHRRLGHPQPRIVEKMTGLKAPDDFNCIECNEVNRRTFRPKLSPFTGKQRRGFSPFEAVHLDMMKTLADRNGVRDFLILVDAHSRFAYSVPMMSLDTPTVLRSVIKILIHAKKRPRQIVTDRAASLTSKTFRDWALSEGIDLIFVSPRLHAQNGTCERLIQTLRRKAVKLLNAARLSTAFLSEAICHATTLYNRTPHRSLNFKTPLEKATGKEISPEFYKRFPMFGATVFFDQGLGLYLGSCNESTEGTILIFTTNQTLIRRNRLACSFDETLLSRRLMPELKQFFTGMQLDVTDTEPMIVRLPRAMRVEPEAPEFFHQVKGRIDANDWIDAMKKEVKSLMDLQTFEIVSKIPEPYRHKTIPSRFVFAKKRSGLKKARLVAGGHRQKFDIFERSSASPTPDPTSLNLVLHLAVQHDYQLKSVDFDSAYLNSTLDETIFMKPPQGFNETVSRPLQEGSALKLKKGLYGLKQAGLLWYKTLRAALMEIGFKKATHDPCLFMHTKTKLLLIVYVDDCVLAGRPQDIEDVVSKIQKNFKIKNAPLDDFLGMKIEQVPGKISVDLEKYETKTIQELGLQDANPAITPVAMNTRLFPAERDEDIIDRDHYLKFLGKLIWITRLRPELDHPTNILCRVAQRPTKQALTTLKRIFRYIKAHPTKIMFTKTQDTAITAYCDAGFAEDHKRKSHGGSLLFIGPNLLTHYSRTQKHVTTSTTESEVTEIFRCAKETLFLRGLLEDLGQMNPKTTIYSDSQSALSLMKTDVMKRSTKHLATKLEFCRELRDLGTHRFVKIDTKRNLADILTKTLPGPRYQDLTRQIMFSRRADSSYNDVALIDDPHIRDQDIRQHNTVTQPKIESPKTELSTTGNKVVPVRGTKVLPTHHGVANENKQPCATRRANRRKEINIRCGEKTGTRRTRRGESLPRRTRDTSKEGRSASRLK